MPAPKILVGLTASVALLLVCPATGDRVVEKQTGKGAASAAVGFPMAGDGELQRRKGEIKYEKKQIKKMCARYKMRKYQS